MNNIIYVAISKKTGTIMSGQNGQFAFDNTTSLAKSVGYAYSHTAKLAGVKAKELYYIKELHINTLPQGEAKPFIVKEVHGTNWNDQGRLSLYVEGSQEFSIGCLSECPEDASLERDLDFVYSVSDLMERAYIAGKQGRPFESITENEDEEEEE